MAPCTWQMCPLPYEHTSPFRPMNGLTSHCSKGDYIRIEGNVHVCPPSVRQKQRIIRYS